MSGEGMISADGGTDIAPPLISFSRAQEIGAQLHDRWATMAGAPAPFTRDDFAWADIVQFVVRHARGEARAAIRSLPKDKPNG